MQTINSFLKNKEHIIWDWNGTLLNDLDLCVRAIEPQLREHGLPLLTAQRYRDMFRFPVKLYYQELGFQFEKTPFEKLAHQFHEEYAKQVHTCRLFEGVAELLSELHHQGYTQSILSAANEDSLRELVSHFGLNPYFKDIYGLSDKFAATKIERGRALIKNTGLNPLATLMIGDTDHDLEVGRALGIDVLLLADGHQSYARLAQVHDRVLESRYAP